MNVEKRDGEIQKFNFDKISRVISKVFNNKPISKDVPEKFVDDVKAYFDNLIQKNDAKNPDYAMNVEEIQDIIRDLLIKKKYINEAESFIIVRNQREEARERNSWLTKAITEKLKGNAIENQNANVDEESFGGKNGEFTRLLTKDYALKYIVSKTARRNHNNNTVYIHDLDNYAVGCHNCLSFPFDKILRDGFVTRQADVRPAKSINTTSQLVAVLFQLQSLEQFGGVSATHIDWTMVPYIRRSFEKNYLYEHIKDTPEFYEIDVLKMRYEDLHDYVKTQINKFFDEHAITHADFRFDNIALFEKKYFQRALFETRLEIEQAVEAMYHNLNTLQSRSGNQLPFTSINYGTCTELEGRTFTQALLEMSIKGTGKFGRTSIFPCGIFQYNKKINGTPGSPNYDLYRLALESTSKRLYPNYANTDWSVHRNSVAKDRKEKREYLASLSDDEMKALANNLKIHPEIMNDMGLYVDRYDYVCVDNKEMHIEIFSTMGCRTQNGFDVNFMDVFKTNIQYIINGEYDKIIDCYSAAQKDGRGNICPVTIILPTLAMLAQRDVEKFMKILDTKIGEAKDALIDRFHYIAKQSPKSAKFMYENGTMCGYIKEEGIISALKHGTLAIGQLGLAETLHLLIGKDHTTTEGMELAKRIEGLFAKRCDEFKKEYKLNFGVYYTPAENLCYTSFKKWKEKYGEFENVTYFINEKGEKEEKLYFTNSMHVPVWYKISPFEKIDIESQLTGYSSAGCITYTETTRDIVNNIDALESQVNHAMDSDIPYYAVNLPSDTCKNCGYQGYLPGKCPVCGLEDIDRLRRVTGYLTGDYTTAFNDGKIDEADDRVVHQKTIQF